MTVYTTDGTDYLDVEDFLEKNKGRFKVEKRFSSCKEEVEIKITNIRFISDYQMSFEFLTDEDKQLYQENDDKIIKLVTI